MGAGIVVNGAGAATAITRLLSPQARGYRPPRTARSTPDGRRGLNWVKEEMAHWPPPESGGSLGRRTGWGERVYRQAVQR